MERTSRCDTIAFTATGTTFILEDHLEDVWGEVSGGVNFFNQANFGGGSSGPGGANGTPVNGSYQNFGTGEPNGANSPTAENVGQFFGTVGKWNDLSPTTTYSNAGAVSQYAVKGFLRETNLAASPLTVDAGTGSVTFAGAVGNVKAWETPPHGEKVTLVKPPSRADNSP